MTCRGAVPLIEPAGATARSASAGVAAELGNLVVNVPAEGRPEGGAGRGIEGLHVALSREATVRPQRALPACGSGAKSMCMTTRRGVGWLTSVNPASAKMLRLPTNISPQTACFPGGNTMG